MKVLVLKNDHVDTGRITPDIPAEFIVALKTMEFMYLQ